MKHFIFSQLHTNSKSGELYASVTLKYFFKVSFEEAYNSTFVYICILNRVLYTTVYIVVYVYYRIQMQMSIFKDSGNDFNLIIPI